jgi:hypothetical protein
MGAAVSSLELTGSQVGANAEQASLSPWSGLRQGSIFRVPSPDISHQAQGRLVLNWRRFDNHLTFRTEMELPMQNPAGIAAGQCRRRVQLARSPLATHHPSPRTRDSSARKVE